MEIWIKKYIDKNIEELIDVDNMKMQELIKYTIMKSARCLKEAQVERIMDVLHATLKGYISSYAEAENYIDIISELNENEAVLFVQIYMNSDVESSENEFNESTENIFKNIPLYTRTYLLNRLEGKGLLSSGPAIASDEEVKEMFDNIDENNCVCNSEGRENECRMIVNRKMYSRTEFGKRLFQSFK